MENTYRSSHLHILLPRRLPAKGAAIFALKPVYSLLEKVRFVWLVTKRSRVQGVPTLGTRTIIDPDPCRKASFTSRSAVVNYGSVFGLDIGI